VILISSIIITSIYCYTAVILISIAILIAIITIIAIIIDDLVAPRLGHCAALASVRTRTYTQGSISHGDRSERQHAHGWCNRRRRPAGPARAPGGGAAAHRPGDRDGHDDDHDERRHAETVQREPTG
jgi:hypothetical protein